MRQRHHEADSNIDTSEVGRTSLVIRVEQNRRVYGDPKAHIKPYDIVQAPFSVRMPHGNGNLGPVRVP